MARRNFRAVLEALPYVVLGALYVFIVLPPLPLTLSPDLGGLVRTAKPRRTSFWSRSDAASTASPPLRLPRYSFEREMRLSLAAVLCVFCMNRLQRQWSPITFDLFMICALIRVLDHLYAAALLVMILARMRGIPPTLFEAAVLLNHSGRLLLQKFAMRVLCLTIPELSHHAKRLDLVVEDHIQAGLSCINDVARAAQRVMGDWIRIPWQMVKIYTTVARTFLAAPTPEEKGIVDATEMELDLGFDKTPLSPADSDFQEAIAQTSAVYPAQNASTIPDAEVCRPTSPLTRLESSGQCETPLDANTSSSKDPPAPPSLMAAAEYPESLPGNRLGSSLQEITPPTTRLDRILQFEASTSRTPTDPMSLNAMRTPSPTPSSNNAIILGGYVDIQTNAPAPTAEARRSKLEEPYSMGIPAPFKLQMSEVVRTQVAESLSAVDIKVDLRELIDGLRQEILDSAAGSILNDSELELLALYRAREKLRPHPKPKAAEMTAESEDVGTADAWDVTGSSPLPFSPATNNTSGSLGCKAEASTFSQVGSLPQVALQPRVDFREHPSEREINPEYVAMAVQALPTPPRTAAYEISTVEYQGISTDSVNQELLQAGEEQDYSEYEVTHRLENADRISRSDGLEDHVSTQDQFEDSASVPDDASDVISTAQSRGTSDIGSEDTPVNTNPDSNANPDADPRPPIATASGSLVQEGFFVLQDNINDISSRSTQEIEPISSSLVQGGADSPFVMGRDLVIGGVSEEVIEFAFDEDTEEPLPSPASVLVDVLVYEDDTVNVQSEQPMDTNRRIHC